MIAAFLIITMESCSAVSNAGASTMMTTKMKAAEKKRLEASQQETR
jgi:hypothetical protein